MILLATRYSKKAILNWMALSGVLVPVQGLCQETAPVAPDTVTVESRETYRLRVENVQYGRIEVSIDGGQHFLLVGRVTKSATAPMTDPLVRDSGSIVRSGGDGIAVAIAPGLVVKILPIGERPSRGNIPKCALVTDLKARTGIFGEFCPVVGTEAQQQVSRAPWKRYPEGLTPSEETVFGFVVTLPEFRSTGDPANAAKPIAAASIDPTFTARLAGVRRRIADLSAQYSIQVRDRALEEKRHTVSGVVVLRAKLPADEPEAITAVTYSIDGDIISSQNTFPSAFGWDTTKFPNGEYVVEVRALSRLTTVITRVRTLVMVNNP